MDHTSHPAERAAVAEEVPGKRYAYANMDSIHTRGATDAVECVTERELPGD